MASSSSLATTKPRATKKRPSTASTASSSHARSAKKLKPIILSSSDNEHDNDDDDDFEASTAASEEGSEYSSAAEGEAEEDDDHQDPADLDSDDIDAIVKPSTSTTKKRKKTAVKQKEDSDGGSNSAARSEVTASGSSKVKEKSKSTKAKSKAKESDKGGKNTRVVQVAKAEYDMPTESYDSPSVLPSTFEFLRQLALPGNNVERDWFKARDPWFRHAEKNWIAFINALVPVASRADWTLPSLPATDLVHRIYRDVKFSKDKTPYKLNFAASLSRTGRKSSFAMYYLHIQPGGKTTVAAGCWSPSASDLATIRHSILADPKPLRKVIAAPEFVKIFGEPTPNKDGSRNSLWGQGDELKNAPKMEGVTKDHNDIDLLKLRTIAVSCRLSDEQVMSSEFLVTLYDLFCVLAPFVQCLNEMILPTEPDSMDEEAAEGEKEEESGSEANVVSSEEDGATKGDDGNDDGSDEE